MKTMTGYGFYKLHHAAYELDCQVSCEPSRFLNVKTEFSPLLAKSAGYLETKMKPLVAKFLSRGKVSLKFDFQPTLSNLMFPSLSLEAVDHYTKLIDQMQKQMAKNLTSSFASLSDISPVDLMRLEGVLVSPNQQSIISNSAFENDVVIAAECGLKKLELFLEQEAQKSKEILLENCSLLGSILSKMNELLAIIRSKNHENQAKSIKDLSSIPSTSEISALDLKGSNSQNLNKRAESIEVAGMMSCLKSFTALVAGGDRVGKRMELLCDRLDAELCQLGRNLTASLIEDVLEMKQIIECLREQAQNIE